MGVFSNAQIVEIRIYADPSNPTSSSYSIALPMTVLEAITDPNTGENLAEILEAFASPATPTQSGLMSAEDKEKLESVAFGATNYVHPTEHPAAMIVESDTRRFISADLLSQLSDLIADGATAAGYSALVSDVAYIAFQLEVQGVISGGTYITVIVDTIDSATAVVINAGQYTNGKVFI
ncbi:MAG: hypothetical protein LBN00_06205 [Oscillospiraceae bacterium]|jgi:hypothetical protein|nr:hypothetical protein [Oscillospiraceae bacterium]